MMFFLISCNNISVVELRMRDESGVDTSSSHGWKKQKDFLLIIFESDERAIVKNMMSERYQV